MTAAELIKNTIPYLKTSDTVQQALDLMHEYHVSDLPVVINNKSAGILNEADLEDAAPDALVETQMPLIEPVKVVASDFFLAPLKMMYQRQISVLPVVKEDGEYIGVIAADDLLKAAAHYNAATEPGGIIILQMAPNDFSISELGRIVESNDARIIHLNTWTDPSNGQLMIAIKINKTDLQDVLASFERYEYNVVQYFGENLSEEELRLNFDHLMNYLNI
ncbi:MAG: CBS domain-containing protein [Chitinophagaceae bacterium]|nr:CBS domain-containing protein [Chitinophagaceae bacterium]